MGVEPEGAALASIDDLTVLADQVRRIASAAITFALSNGKPAVLVVLYRQPAANVIDTVDRVKAVLPHLETSIPGAIKLDLVMDRTKTIKVSLHDVERALDIASESKGLRRNCW
jgi:multidrug efflux pump